MHNGYESVWQSGKLTERDLNIPKNPNTHPTGSSLFDKGSSAGIDQRHYFKDVVFGRLDWQPDPKPSKEHLARANAIFGLIIKGKDHGEFPLRLTHNTKTNTATYDEDNSVTQVHWGLVGKYIRQEELLGLTLNLYRSTNMPDHFIIEIE